jgi:4-amino-4-deoxy-L-arabinose transferase-like glycosyltransferase
MVHHMTPHRLPPVVVTAAVAALLALHWWLGVSATFKQSLAFDEVSHLTGGFAYWRFNDYRLQPENGNLPQRWGTLPWLLLGAHMPTDNKEAWARSDVWSVGEEFLFGSGNNTLYLAAYSHALMALWSVGTGLLIFGWSRRFWGDTGGLLSLALFSLCPNFLAHGPLVTSDMAMAFFFLASTTAWWRHLHRPTFSTGLLSALLLGLACVVKFSCVLLAPMFLLLALVRYTGHDASSDVATRRLRAGTLIFSMLAHLAVAWVIIWAFFGFRYSAFAPEAPAAERFYVTWQRIAPASEFMRGLFERTRDWHLLPQAYLQGLAFVLSAAQQRGAFLNGEYNTLGWWWFFPYAFLVKTPPAQLLAYLVAGGLIVKGWWRTGSLAQRWHAAGNGLRTAAPLVVVPGVYWAASITSHLNIGHRHLLPVYPALFVLAGAVVARLPRRAGAVVGMGLAGWALVSMLAIRPHYLAYFNVFAGGPTQAHYHLIDSSLDWGQELPGLAEWLAVHRRPGEPVYLSYFGSANYHYYGIQAQELALYPLVPQPLFWHSHLGAGLYCVSVTMLRDVYSPWSGAWSLDREKFYQELRRVAASPPVATPEGMMERARQLWRLDRLRFARLCQYLRVRPPDATIGYSILIYRLSAAEIHTAVDGTLPELSAAVEHAIQGKRQP